MTTEDDVPEPAQVLESFREHADPYITDQVRRIMALSPEDRLEFLAYVMLNLQIGLQQIYADMDADCECPACMAQPQHPTVQ